MFWTDGKGTDNKADNMKTVYPTPLKTPFGMWGGGKHRADKTLHTFDIYSHFH